ncbi:MAG: carboxynorspermidine decarboxylase [Cytophagales bacterium]|nr:carboxynorspermidine decarboxylase [Cytophagales bacterium]MDW8384791.1 carboxynorspermidine decarboxylase [Flammeovirgaceae bacterium]
MVDLTSVPSPCFLLEEKLLRNNLELLHYVQKEAGVKIILALKGFAMYHTFDLVRQYLPGTTASSLNEARLGFEEFGGEVHAYSPAYLEREFDELMTYCGHITFNSINQYFHFKPRIEAFSKKISCGLRINPEYSPVKTDLYNPCVKGSRLGVTSKQLSDRLPEGIEGLHSHNLCESSAEALEETLQNIRVKFGKFLSQIQWLNLGGGHAITRKGYNIDLLIKTLKNFKNEYSHLEIILEPGSAVAWETGYLVATVLDIVENDGVLSAMLDVSFTCHMPDTLEMPYKPRIHGAFEPIEGLPTYKMGGLSCLAGDVMGDYSFPKPLQIGDKLIFDDMIHYTMVKTTNFNGVPLPYFAIRKESGELQIVREPRYEHFKDRL